jgi:hypothetical protein
MKRGRGSLKGQLNSDDIDESEAMSLRITKKLPGIEKGSTK